MSTLTLSTALLPKTKRLIFRELFRVGDDSIHLRELARRIGLDASGVRRELNNLVESGIVLETDRGNLKEYKMNVECPVYPELRSLIMKTVGLVDEVREALTKYEKTIDFAYIYGSYADGTYDSYSDVDLMIVGDVSLREIATDLARVSKELRREINPTIYGRAEYFDKLKKKNNFVYRVHNGNRLLMTGDVNEPG